jgi:hypothetical protein
MAELSSDPYVLYGAEAMERLTNVRVLHGWEGGESMVGTFDGKPAVGVNESVMADFLGEDDGPLESLTRVFVFASAAERASFLLEEPWLAPPPQESRSPAE